MVVTYKRFKEEIKEFEKARENKVKNKSLLEIFFTLLAEKASIDFLEKELRKECLSVEEKNAVKKCCIEAKKKLYLSL